MKINYKITFWVLLVLTFLFKMFYIGWGSLDLVPDEAQYWDWSRNLDLSYYSKGPFIAYTIFIGTKIGHILAFSPPNPAFWVKFMAVLNSTLLGLVAWFFSLRLWKDYKISLYSILLLLAIPIYSAGSVLITIDNPLMLFWAVYICLVFMAIDTGKARYWYLAGIAFGFGFLSKYTMLILPLCVILYLAMNKEHRFWLKKKEFYFGFLISIIFLFPVVIWNMQHDWVSFKHVIGQAGLTTTEKEPFFSLLNTLEFLAIQFGVISPIILILIFFGFYKAWRLRQDYRYSFLFWMGIPLGLLYLLLSLHEYCQANWPAPMYFTGALIIASVFAGKKILKYGIILGLILSLLIFTVDLLPFIPNRLDPTLRARGWKKLGEEVGKANKDLSKIGKVFIFSDTYQITSELAFYVPGQPKTYCANLGRRMNQYDLWQDFNKLIGYNAIYVKHRDQEIEKEIKENFKECYKLSVVDITKGKRTLHQYSIFICKGFAGFKNKTNEITY